MGRHTRQEPASGLPASGHPASGRRHPDAELIESLPGWGLFATAVAAVSLRCTATGWPQVGAVTALGLGTTAALWWMVCRGEHLRHLLAREAEVTMTSRSASLTIDTPAGCTAPRRVTP